MTDRDAAPAAAEGADDELYAEFLRGFMPEVAPTSLVGLTLRHAWDAALEVYGAARRAPAAELKPGAENFNSDGGDEGDFNSPAPAAAPREDDDFRAGYAQAQSDAMCGCKCEGSKRVSLTVYRGNGPEQEVIDCRFCELIPPMFERGAAAREAARGEGDTNGL